MILGIMSDSHGNCAAVKRAVDLAGKVDLWLHAGDLCTDAKYLEEYSQAKVISVAGNCDGLAAPSKVDEFFEVEGKKIWLTHGHEFKVKLGSALLIQCAKKFHHVDLAVYGHTHVVDISQHGDLKVLNPGSVARPYYTKPSFLKVKIEAGEILPELIEFSYVHSMNNTINTRNVD